MKPPKEEKPIQTVLREIVMEYAAPRGLNTDMIFNRVTGHFLRARKKFLDEALQKYVPADIARKLLLNDAYAIEWVYQAGFRCQFTGSDTRGDMTNLRMSLVDRKGKKLDGMVFTMNMHRAVKE